MSSQQLIGCSSGTRRSASGSRLAALILAAVLGATAGAGALWMIMHREVHAPEAERAAAGETLYHCPMHPKITSDRPGECPICGMRLVPVEGVLRSDTGSADSREPKIAFYRSPMNPAQTSPVPGKDETGMDYLPVYEDEVRSAGEEPVKGLATVTIDTARQQLIGLRTQAVMRGPVGGSWRTVGRVETDPTRVRNINVKVEGYVENMYVDFLGKSVHQGDPLFSLYSPSLLTAQNEYLLALQTREALARGGTLAADGAALVTSARRKLELWDVSTREIERLERTGQPSKALTFLSPISGVVTAKNVVEGSRLAPGDTAYEITDLSTVWVMADAYESDLRSVGVGMPATLTLPAYPERSFDGEVAFIDPLLDARTRTVRVHLHFPNPTGELKPQMYGEVVLHSAPREGLRIPFDAVVQSGTRNVVFLALGGGRFQPCEVQLGARSGDQVEVLSGLEGGQNVVTRGNFLVDSESQLRAALAAMAGG